MATIPSGLVGKQESAVTKTLEGLGFEVKTDKVLGGLFGTVRTVKAAIRTSPTAARFACATPTATPPSSPSPSCEI